MEGRVGRVLWGVIFGFALLASAFTIADFYLWPDPGNLFLDAHIYYRATEAWLAGANPWTTSYREVPFAGFPPTLLLNLPLLPFGESAAAAIWATSNTVSVAYLIRRLDLPLWIVFVYPIVEGWLAGSADLTLAALVLVGGRWLGLGWLGALTKPYSAPTVLARGHWRQVVIAGLLVLVTLPVLPWWTFYDSRAIVTDAFVRFAANPVSASGSVPLMAATAIALVTLGWRRGLVLLTPGLLAQQPHYIVFSIQAVKWSRILALAFTLPVSNAAALGIVVYAAAGWLRRPTGHAAASG